MKTVPDWNRLVHSPLYDASVPVFVRYLSQLSDLCSKAAEFAQLHNLDQIAILSKRIEPDMLPLKMQVVIAMNFSLRATFPLIGKPTPQYVELTRSISDLQARIHRIQNTLSDMHPSDFIEAESRVIQCQAGNAILTLQAADFLYQFALPNFFFHTSMTYAILRHTGVPLGKKYFDGFHEYTSTK